MANIDVFLIGLLAGTVVGFAGILQRLLEVAGLVAVALLAWVLVRDGQAGVQAVVGELVHQVLLPNLRLAAGFVLGAILGTSLTSALRVRGH